MSGPCAEHSLWLSYRSDIKVNILINKIKRTASGAIDTDYYVARGRQARAVEIQTSLISKLCRLICWRRAAASDPVADTIEVSNIATDQTELK